AVFPQQVVEQGDAGRDLVEAVPLRVIRALGRGDEQAEDQGGHGGDQARAQPHHVLRLVAEVSHGQQAAQEQAEQPRAEDGGEQDRGDEERAHRRADRPPGGPAGPLSAAASFMRWRSPWAANSDWTHKTATAATAADRSGLALSGWRQNAADPRGEGWH